MRIPLSRVAPPLAALLLGACTTSEGDGPGRLATNDDPGYSASGAEVIETGADGLPRYRLRADKVRQDPATGTVALEGVDMTVSRPGADRWRVQAERGELPADARRVTLQGDVRLESEAPRRRSGRGALRDGRPHAGGGRSGGGSGLPTGETRLARPWPLHTLTAPMSAAPSSARCPQRCC